MSDLTASLRYVLHMFGECAIKEDDPHLDALSRHITELEAHKSLWNRIETLERSVTYGNDEIARLEAELAEFTPDKEP